MKGTGQIESIQFYISVNKPKDENSKSTLNEIVIGNDLAKICKASGAVKLKKVGVEETKTNVNSTYQVYKRLVKEEGSKWLIISKSELKESTFKDCKSFNVITQVTYKDLTTADNRRPFRTKHHIYIITF